MARDNDSDRNPQIIGDHGRAKVGGKGLELPCGPRLSSSCIWLVQQAQRPPCPSGLCLSEPCCVHWQRDFNQPEPACFSLP